MVLCFSPVGDAFRQRLRMFPSLVNCTTIDWFNNWPVEALRSVAKSFCADLELGPTAEGEAGEARMLEGVLAACVHIHQSVEAKSKRYFEELCRSVACRSQRDRRASTSIQTTFWRQQGCVQSTGCLCVGAPRVCRRYNYVTPTSYLELLSTFLKLLSEKRSELTTAKKRLESGLDKLTSTAAQVEDMQKELQELQPVLAATAKEVEGMMQVIAHDKEEAAQTKRTVEQQEREANEQAAVAKSIAGQALPQALSSLHATVKHCLLPQPGLQTSLAVHSWKPARAQQHAHALCLRLPQMMPSGSLMPRCQLWMLPLPASKT